MLIEKIGRKIKILRQLLFNISNEVNFKQIKGLKTLLWLAFKPKFESHKKLSRKTHTLQRL